MGTSIPSFKLSFFGCIASLRGTHNLDEHTRTPSIIAFRAPRATRQNSKLLEAPKC
jgi:hypothetical protein